MKRNLFLSVVLIAGLIAGCSSGKQFTTRETETAKVKTIAILPVQVNFTGNLPNKVTPVMLDSMKVQQGLMFQQALQANLLRYSGGRNKISGVSFQSADKTNGMLAKNNLALQEIGRKDPDELAKLLQVDAVVKMNVTSNRMMSDLASLGLGALRSLLWWETNTSPAVTSSITNKTADVYADCALLKDGKTLWTAQYDRPTDWNTSVNDVIQTITKKMGKGFPY
jgi:hypothetical protein